MLRSRLPAADRADRRRRARLGRVTLEAADGSPFRAFRARATTPNGAGIVILPDVRGLHPFYEELALRFAENGVDALAIDYFGRTAGVEPSAATTSSSHAARRPGDVARRRRGHPRGGASTSGWRTRAGSSPVHGRVLLRRAARLPDATLGLGLAGSIGFYGIPAGPGERHARRRSTSSTEMTNPILGICRRRRRGDPAETSPRSTRR